MPGKHRDRHWCCGTMLHRELECDREVARIHRFQSRFASAFPVSAICRITSTRPAPRGHRHGESRPHVRDGGDSERSAKAGGRRRTGGRRLSGARLGRTVLGRVVAAQPDEPATATVGSRRDPTSSCAHPGPSGGAQPRPARLPADAFMSSSPGCAQPVGTENRRTWLPMGSVIHMLPSSSKARPIRLPASKPVSSQSRRLPSRSKP